MHNMVINTIAFTLVLALFAVVVIAVTNIIMSAPDKIVTKDDNEHI